MKTINIALIGSGYGGVLHANGYRKVSKVPVKIKTVVDAYDLEKAQKLANNYGIENVSRNIEDILNDPEIDIVDICTPPMSHVDITMRALKAGKHVICEKPLTGWLCKVNMKN